MVAPGAKKPPSSRLDASGRAALRAQHEALAQVEETFRDFDIVWAKIHGFPWWPGVLFHSWDVVRRAGIQTDPKIVTELVVPPPEKVVELDAVTGQETANFRLKRHCLIMFLDKFNFSLVEINPSNVASFTSHYHLYEHAVLGSKSGRWSKKKSEFRRALVKATELLHLGMDNEEPDLVILDEPNPVEKKQRIEKAAKGSKKKEEEEQNAFLDDAIHQEIQLVEDRMGRMKEELDTEKKQKVVNKVPKKPLVQEEHVVEVKDTEDEEEVASLTWNKPRRKAAVKPRTKTRRETSSPIHVAIVSRSPSPVNLTASPEKTPQAVEMEKEKDNDTNVNEKKETLEEDVNEVKPFEDEGDTSLGMEDKDDVFVELSPRQENEDQRLEPIASISEEKDSQNTVPTPLSSIWTTGMSSSDSTKEPQVAFTQAFVWNDAVFTDEDSVANTKHFASAQLQQQQQFVDHGTGRERKRQSRSVQQAQIRQNLLAGNLDPHTMVQCAAYRSKEYVDDPTSRSRGNPTLDPPFEVVVHPDAVFVADLHAHLATCEIIGFLGGKWDEGSKILYIQAAFPCRSLVIDGDDGSTDVEMDPGSEIELRSIIENAQLEVVGWYHSHPAFAPDPSVRDIENQTSYQQLFQRPSGQDPFKKQDETNKRFEPFVGLIVGTYDTRRQTPVSLFRYFHTRSEAGNGAARRKISMPYEFIPRRRYFKSVLEDEERIRMQSCSMYHSVLQYFKFEFGDSPYQLPVDVKTPLGPKAMYRSPPTRVRASGPLTKRKHSSDETGEKAGRKTRPRGRPPSRSSLARNRPVSNDQPPSKEQTIDSAQDTKTEAMVPSSHGSVEPLKAESPSVEAQSANVFTDVVETTETAKNNGNGRKRARKSLNPKRRNDSETSLTGGETKQENAVALPSSAPLKSQEMMQTSATPIQAPVDVETTTSTLISPSSLIALSSDVMSTSKSRKRTRKPTSTTKTSDRSASSSSEPPSSALSPSQAAVRPSGSHVAIENVVQEEVTLPFSCSDGLKPANLMVKHLESGHELEVMDVPGTQDKDRTDEMISKYVNDLMEKMVAHIVAVMSDGMKLSSPDTEENATVASTSIKTFATDTDVGITQMKTDACVNVNETAKLPLFGSHRECEDIQTSLEKLAGYMKSCPSCPSVVAEPQRVGDSTPKTKLKLVPRRTKRMQEDDDKDEQAHLLSLRTNYGAGVSSCVEQVISLIDYYRDFERRTDLTEQWKARVTKLEKIQSSLSEYVQYLEIPVALRRDFIQDVILYLRKSWRTQDRRR